MRRLHKLSIFFLLTFLITPGWTLTFDEIGDMVLEEIWRFHPVSATYVGIHQYDTLLPDYSQDRIEQMLRRYKELDQMLMEIDTLTLTQDQLIDYHLLRVNIADEVFTIEKVRAYEKDPLIYVSACVNGVYSIMLRSAPSVHQKIKAVKQRLSQVRDFLDTAANNLTRPSHVLCEIGIEQLVEGEQLIRDISETFEDSLSEDERLDFQTAKNSALAAMKWFAFWLDQNCDPQEPYVLGRDNYNYRLRHIHLLDIDADSLLQLGKGVLASINIKIDSLEEIYERPTSKKIMLPQDFGPDDVRAYQQGEIEYMREFVAQSGIVTVPDRIGALVVVETPGFLRCIIPGIAMHPPGAFEDLNTSYFYVQSLPARFDVAQVEFYYNYVYNRQFRRSVVHEGYPGHHLQISIAHHHPSPVRKCYSDFFFVEGWALYCEELMSRSELYKDTLGAIINTCYGTKFRAARVVVDVMLQTERFSYEEAVSFLIEAIGYDSTFLSKEVKRYITNPGQPSSYLFGKLQILELLQKYKAAMGDRFELRNFHDKLLSYGSIPIKLIGKDLMSEIERERM
jgi:uncharacterized protein (DUF885 family)